MTEEAKIIIIVPGKWKTRTDFVQDIAQKSDGLLFAGLILMDTKTKEGFKAELHPYDRNLAKTFSLAGGHSISAHDIDDVKSHTFSLFVTGPGGSLAHAQKILEIGCGLLRAGGIAVKVETTGKAHSAKDWLALAEAHNETALYHAFVTLVGDKGTYYSCGMHNLGYRDALVKGKLSANQAAAILQSFLLYTLIEKPTIKDGHTFSESATAPHYRLQSMGCTTYPKGHSFFNPYGMWRLELMHN